MVWVTERNSNCAIQPLVQQIVAAGELSRQDYMQLTSAILADYKLSNEDRCRISRVLDYVQIGRLKLVD